MKTALALGLVAALLTVGWLIHRHGYQAGVDATTAGADARVHAAEAARDLAQADQAATEQTIANVRASLVSLKERLKAQQATDSRLLADNVALTQRITAQAAEAQRQTLKVAHDDPQCADLARLPVCPTVARRLWGEAAVHPSAERH